MTEIANVQKFGFQNITIIKQEKRNKERLSMKILHIIGLVLLFRIVNWVPQRAQVFGMPIQKGIHFYLYFEIIDMIYLLAVTFSKFGPFRNWPSKPDNVSKVPQNVPINSVTDDVDLKDFYKVNTFAISKITNETSSKFTSNNEHVNAANDTFYKGTI